MSIFLIILLAGTRRKKRKRREKSFTRLEEIEFVHTYAISNTTDVRAHKFPSTLNTHSSDILRCLQKKIGFLFSLGAYIFDCLYGYMGIYWTFLKTDLNYRHVCKTCYKPALRQSPVKDLYIICRIIPLVEACIRWNFSFPSNLYIHSKSFRKIFSAWKFWINEIEKASHLAFFNEATVESIKCVCTFYANELPQQRKTFSLLDLSSRKYN